MHQSANPEQGARECSMRGLCNGPAVALGSLFSVPGILLAPLSMHVDLSASALTVVVVTAHTTPASLDTPPPRA
jgi:hypothetical protein